MNRRNILALLLGFGAALAVAAASYSGRPGSLGVLTPRTGPGYSATTSATQRCLTEAPGAFHATTNPCAVVPFGAAMTLNATSGPLCACWSMTATISMGSTCGQLTDAQDGATAVVGNCLGLIQGQIVDASPSRAWFNRAGVGRRTGYCASDSFRPCRVDGDCVTGTCTSGGVGAPAQESAGAYLILKSTGAGTAFVGNSVGE